MRIDTHGGKKSLLKAPFQVLTALSHSRNVIIFPAHNGIRIYAPLLVAGKNFFRTKGLHYVVIGGWLPDFLQRRKMLKNCLKQFDGIYVETRTVKHKMERQGFQNVIVMPNCKNLDILDESELVYHYAEPYKLCTFSRVMKEKGIEDAVNAIKEVNESTGRVVYTLDIYGQVETEQTEWFCNLEAAFPQYIHYKGTVDYSRSVDTLKNYFALLFPTKFYTEGIPGTILDAYAAGIPVICSRWESFADIVDEHVTGIGYSIKNEKQLSVLLKNIAADPNSFQELKKACLKKAKAYEPDAVITSLNLVGE